MTKHRFQPAEKCLWSYRTEVCKEQQQEEQKQFQELHVLNIHAE
jgi:hypothetical protein